MSANQHLPVHIPSFIEVSPRKTACGDTRCRLQRSGLESERKSALLGSTIPLNLGKKSSIVPLEHFEGGYSASLVL